MSWRRLLSNRLPADIFIALVLTVCVNVLTISSMPVLAPLRVVVGVAFVVLVPGYVLTTALFPHVSWDASVIPEPDQIDHQTLSAVQRGTIAIAFSISVVSLLGIAVNYTPVGITSVWVLLGLDLIVLIATAVSVYRRPFTGGLSVLSEIAATDLFGSCQRNDSLLNALLLVSVIVLIGSVGVALTVPSPADSHSNLYLATETEGGNLTAMDYPQNLTVGEPTELVVGVANNEFEQTHYTVVVRVQSVTRSSGETTVTRSRELSRFEPTLAHNETWEQRHEVVPPFAGDRIRLQYLLFIGQPSGNLSSATAYRNTHLWVSVADTTAT